MDSTPRLRLVGMRVIPVLMSDDGDNLTQVESPPLDVSAADWPAYSAEGWPAQLEAYQAELTASQSPPAPLGDPGP